MELQFEILDGLSLYNMMPIEISNTYQGFTCFSNKCASLHVSNSQYVIAKHNSKIVGVIKFTNSELYASWILTWIDIHEDFRNKGIATALLNYSNSSVISKTSLLITSETQLGKICNISQLCKKLLNKLHVFSYDDYLSNTFKVYPDQEKLLT